MEMAPWARVLWASWRFALLLAVAGLLAAAGAAWFVQHVRGLRADRVRTGNPVACTVVEAREVYGFRTGYPEIRVRLVVDGVVRTAWLRALRPTHQWRPGDVVVVYVDDEGGLSTADGYLSERLQVVSTDPAVAAAGFLLLLAAMATVYAGSAAHRRRRVTRIALFVAAIDGNVIQMRPDGELSNAWWTRPLGLPARARAVAVLGHHLDDPPLPLVVPVSQGAATLILHDTPVSTAPDTIAYVVIGRAIL
jgi:hypothetical protein